VILAHVHAVRVDRHGNVHPVVHDQRHACLTKLREKRATQLHELARGMFLPPQLHHAHPTRNGSHHYIPHGAAECIGWSGYEVERQVRQRPPHATSAMRARDSSVSSLDRKSTRLNSSHVKISYAVFCLRKKKYKSKAARAARH